jgi:hypothetical protein
MCRWLLNGMDFPVLLKNTFYFLPNYSSPEDCNLPRRNLPVAITKCSCPECGASLKLNKPAEIGKKLICPKCKTPFQIGEDYEEDTPQAREKSTPIQSNQKRSDERKIPKEEIRSNKRPRDEDDFDDDPSRTRMRSSREDFDDEELPRRNKGKSRKKGSLNKKIMTWVLASILILGAGGVLIWGISRRNPPEFKGRDDGVFKVEKKAEVELKGEIELYDAKAEWFHDKGPEQERWAINWRVKYRFTKDGPLPYAIYSVYIQEEGKEPLRITYDTGNVHSAGMFQGGILVDRNTAPKSLRFQIFIGNSTTPVPPKKISNEAKCDVPPFPG